MPVAAPCVSACSTSPTRCAQDVHFVVRFYNCEFRFRLAKTIVDEYGHAARTGIPIYALTSSVRAWIVDQDHCPWPAQYVTPLMVAAIVFAAYAATLDVVPSRVDISSLLKDDVPYNLADGVMDMDAPAVVPQATATPLGLRPRRGFNLKAAKKTSMAASSGARPSRSSGSSATKTPAVKGAK